MSRDVVARILAAGPWVRRAALAGVGASLLPALSFGLGLGDIQVESRLNQPLYARIEVVDVTDDEWREMRARVARRTSLREGFAHPDILASLTLRAVENGKGGHFIEVKSGDVLTEPLFDLPLELEGQSLRLVRNYSVLLDPATSDDASGSMLAASAQPAGAAIAGTPLMRSTGGGIQDAAVANLDAQGQTSRRDHAQRVRKEGESTHGVVNGPKAGGGSNRANAVPVARAAAVIATRPSGEDPLQRQLASLQQTLTEMQATVASQKAEIDRLTAQVAARSASSALPRPSTWVEYPAGSSESSSEGGIDGPSGWLRNTMLYWIGGVIVGLAALVAGVVGFLRWRHVKMLREIASEEAARRPPPPQPAVARTSERDLLAWQSNLRAAQSGTWKQSLDEASAVTASASEDTVAVTVAIEELTQDHEADLESLIASYEAEHSESTSGGGAAAWRAQNEMLERDYYRGKDASDSGFVEKIAV